MKTEATEAKPVGVNPIVYDQRRKAIEEASEIMKKYNSILFNDASEKWEVTAKIATFLLSGAYRL